MNFKKAVVIVASLALLASPCFANSFADGIGNDVENQAFVGTNNGNYDASGSFPATGADAWGYNNAGAGSIARALDNPTWGTAEAITKTKTPEPLVGATSGNVLGADVAAAGSLSTAHSETHADAKGDFARGGIVTPWADYEKYNSRPSNNIGPYPGMVDTSGGLQGHAEQGSWAGAQQNDTLAMGGQNTSADYQLNGLDDTQRTVITDDFRITKCGYGIYGEKGYIHSEHEAYGDAVAAGGTVAFAYDRPNFAAAGGITAGASGADVDVVKGDSYDINLDAQGNGTMQHSASVNAPGVYGESNGFASFDYNGTSHGAGVAATGGYTTGYEGGGISVSKGFAGSTGGISDRMMDN